MEKVFVRDRAKDGIRRVSKNGKVANELVMSDRASNAERKNRG